ncbi:hypothetical protein P153DRAFT_348476 [Dothidotthia symphoricarpi CBS 119687]|uniref:Uncharacterized protein n=1 Tax=Dothidotthia symphoricarpi CBS 119687 TaxID=1392245 RepID=A0A6A6A454_9PLEO|nr:uncharacterized protein P153DRAFT_348476 [Dothidotthia symphoricarpi CBS 119687]KAF2125371.1 hypothetical protein P153DRAFT_348476 [Dothidotthia symphoricarpi CBS 119687]
MNTVKSVYYGWGTLIAAGGGAYYFAKKSINADRAAKAEADRVKRQRQYQLEQSLASSASTTPISGAGAVTQGKTGGQGGSPGGEMGNPSVQASQDPAATRHEGEEGAKSKYEASGVFRSRKGDRFS